MARRDYDLIVARVPSDDDAWARRYVRHRRVDGVLMIDRALSDEGMHRLYELGAPLVVWGPIVPGQAYTSVGCDSVAGAASAVGHLAGLGRRCIG
ncbi:MAG: LacI family transcriptional regulator, partial [Blastochloris sp.]|nr:LacI family transcriptional regulator [Blastochloris sp.]